MRKTIILLAVILAVLAAIIATGYYQMTDRVEGKYFESDGIRLHYTVEGEGEPVILLHGFAVNADLNWRKPGIIEALSSDYQVITLDHRGHGLSEKPHDPDEYGIHLVNDVVNLLDHLHIEKAHLVGYSLGGFIALKCAALYPERWITVIPMASGWEDPKTSKGFNALSRVAEDLKAGKSIGPIIAYFDDRKEPGLLHKMWVKILTTWFNDKEALYALVMAAPDLVVTENQIKLISNPVCGIVGSDDPFLKSAKSMQAHIENSQLIVLKGENHITTPSQAETKKALLLFLRQHSLNDHTVKADVKQF